jgi:hypothetical protein
MKSRYTPGLFFNSILSFGVFHPEYACVLLSVFLSGATGNDCVKSIDSQGSAGA